MGEVNAVALKFLSDFVAELPLLNSDTAAGNYALELCDVLEEALDAASYYLEQRSCPPLLRAYLAKKAAASLCTEVDANEACPYATGEALHMATLNSLNKLCHNLLEQPELIESSALEGSLPFTSSDFAIKNRRRKMEDRHVVIHDLNLYFPIEDTPKCSYYAVFDGHAGIDAATFAAAHLHANIVNHSLFLSDTAEAISQAYAFTDKQFCDRANKEGIRGGCTAVSALIMNEKLYIAWLGDSQALLVKQGKPVTLMTPHKPDREDERARIESLGGFVCHLGTWRVLGTLAVSRAIGDFEFKPYVCSQAEITVTPLDGTEDFLVLACDGLWDCVSPEQVTAALYTTICNSPDNAMDNIAEKLVYLSKDMGSDDNITAVVVFLRNLADIANEASNYSFPVFNSVDMPLKDNCGDLSKDEVIARFDVQDQSYVPERPKNLQDISEFPSLKSDCEPSNPPPEATFLSELPTPPIDDLMTSGASRIAEELSKLEINADEEGKLCSLSTQSILANGSEDQTPKSELKRIDSKEAIQIANDIVSNIIETAVVELANNELQKDKSVPEEESTLILPEIITAENIDISYFLMEFSSVEEPQLMETVPIQSISTAHAAGSHTVESNIIEAAVEMNVNAVNDCLQENSVDITCNVLPEKAEVAVDSGDSNSKNHRGESMNLNQLISLAGEALEEKDVGNNNTSPSADMLLTSDIIPDVAAEPLAVVHATEVPKSDEALATELDIHAITAIKVLDQNENSEEALPNISDDLPTVAVALDLKSVPEYIPEADGVAEDNDSGSETNCGWSYVKASTDASADKEVVKDLKPSAKSKALPLKSSTIMKTKSPNPSSFAASKRLATTTKAATLKAKTVTKASTETATIRAKTVTKTSAEAMTLRAKTVTKTSADAKPAMNRNVPNRVPVEKVQKTSTVIPSKTTSAKSTIRKTVTDGSAKLPFAKAKEASGSTATVAHSSKPTAATVPASKQNGITLKRPAPPSNVKTTLPVSATLKRPASGAMAAGIKDASKVVPKTTTLTKSKPALVSNATRPGSASTLNRPGGLTRPLASATKTVATGDKVKTTQITNKSPRTIPPRVTTKATSTAASASKSKNVQTLTKGKKETTTNGKEASKVANSVESVPNPAASNNNP